MSPQRIQRRRTKGWRMPENTIYVGRPSKWSNPYAASGFGCTPETAVALFRDMLDRAPKGLEIETTVHADIKSGLAGKNLACWCRLDQPCHADILLELANDMESPNA